ncbi:MAG: nicotinamide mononucleotide transporter [Clostridia bacterium]|nr:nicotinamide mononucleotide transporter [Clostridia bacterium]
MKLTKFEKTLWISSMLIITICFFLGIEKNPLTLIASLIGVTSLILIAKGNLWGQVLMIIFSLIYGYISYKTRYYGEMITYVGMTAPMAVMALVTWLKNPFEGEENQVAVAEITPAKLIITSILTIIVTTIFWFILKYFNTANLVLSTLSVLTSFFAASLTFLRSPYYALGYAANDVVLIILWILASMENAGYIPMMMCFVVFLVNDIYGFVSWKRMAENQKKRIREIVGND